MRPRRSLRPGPALAFAAWLTATTALAQTAPVAKAAPAAPTFTKEEVGELSGLAIIPKTREPTPLSGVDVVVRRSTQVSELTVVAPKCPPAQTSADPDAQPPKLISSYPAQGSTVRGGIIILRLTFDRPMTCVGLLDYSGERNPCPAPLTNPLFSRDRRTFLTVCTMQQPAEREEVTDNRANYKWGYRYGVRLQNFTSLSGQAFAPRNLDFYVNHQATPVKTVREAMAQDPFLRDAQKAAEQAER